MRRSGGPSVLVVLGLFFIGIGGGVAYMVNRGMTAEVERATRLSAVSATRLDDLPAGSEVLVEGLIAPSNRADERGMVASVTERYKGKDNDGHDEWRVSARATPPLLLTAGGGAIQIANTGYDLRARPHMIEPKGGLYYNGITGDASERYSGFKAGDVVVAVGRTVPGREGMAVEAEFLSGGTRAQLIDSGRTGARIAVILGAVFVVIGLAMAAFGLIRLVR